MNRRSFLGSLIGSAAALVLDPERLLWVPHAKTIFIPKQPISAVVSEYADFITTAYNREALRQLQRQFVFSGHSKFRTTPTRKSKTVQWYRYELGKL